MRTASAQGPGGTTPARPVSLRVRMVLVLLALMSLLLAASTLLTRVWLDNRLSVSLTQELQGEVAEFRLLAEEGIDPQTGEPFTDAGSLLRLQLARSIPDDGESMFVVVGGQVAARSDDVPPVRLDRDPDFVARVNGATSTEYGSYESEAGKVLYAVVPVRTSGAEGASDGAFVVLEFVGEKGAAYRDVTRAQLLVSALVLTVGTAVAWVLAGRALAPVRAMQSAARTINGGNLEGRMPLRHDPGSRLWDEFDDLSSTINDMLGRLETAFAGQRRFLDDAGHELRTPLTIVRGHLELLADEPEELDETLELVSDELDRMARLVADLQTLTTATQPGFVQVGPTDSAELIADVVAKARALADREWVLDSAGSVTVALDRHRLTQALLELVTNAVRWTGPGDVIGLGAAVSGSSVEFWVRDTGPGVPPEVAEQMFDRFVHAEGSSGSGLGLSIVSVIAHGHGGEVRFTPEKPHGARFVVSIPLTAGGAAR